MAVPEQESTDGTVPVRPVPTASQLDLSMACPGSRELPHVETVETPAMTAGRDMHRSLQQWIEAGCPEAIFAPPHVAKRLAPRDKIPNVHKLPELPAIAEVAVWVDPVFETAGIICTGRRPEKHEYPGGEHVFSGTIDAAGQLDDGRVVALDWKSRVRSDWQVRFAAVAVSLLTKAPEVLALEVFNPSGHWDERPMGPEDLGYALGALKEHAKELLAQRAGFPARFQTGEHCRFCRAWAACPRKEEARAHRSKANGG